MRDMSKPERPSEMKRQAGLRLRAVREHLELKQESMANMLGCTRTALANWENGERMPDVAAMVRLYLRPGQTDLPSACIKEFAEMAMLDAQINMRGRLAQRSHVVSAIEYRARDIASLLSPHAMPGLGELSWTGQLLRKHGVLP